MELVRSKKSGDTLTVAIQGEIDHCTASDIRMQIEELLRSDDIHRLRFDFSGVSFMDSSGIGMIIGRYKTMLAKKGSVSVFGLSPSVSRLFRMSGLHRIVFVETKEEGMECL